MRNATNCATIIFIKTPKEEHHEKEADIMVIALICFIRINSYICFSDKSHTG